MISSPSFVFLSSVFDTLLARAFCFYYAPKHSIESL